MKQTLYALLEPSIPTTASRTLNNFLLWLIMLNVLAVMLQTVEPLNARYGPLFAAFEVFSVAVFALEYLARLWTANLKPQFASSRFPRLRYAVSASAVIDLLAILPFFLPVELDLRHLRALRLFRLVRAMKLGRYSRAIQTMGRVVQNKREELMVAVSAVLIVLLFASTLMYAIEGDVQPEAFSSIPETMWWGVATLTTVGYGDVYPVTDLGRFVGGLVAIFCLGLFALPVGIIASGFVEEMQPKSSRTCPHCGKEL